jgi:translation initiation factor 2 subunit 1
MKDTPDIEELVIVRIKKIFPYGAFCELEEYPQREAFVHLSEVSSGWVKNIHNFLKEGQRTVGRVYRLVPEKNLIDVSLKRATESDKKLKLEMFRREKRATKLLEVACIGLKKSKMTAAEVLVILRKEHGDSLSAFEEAATNGEASLEKIGISSDWAKAITEIAAKNIKKQKKSISGVMMMNSNGSNGLNDIKEALGIVPEKDGKLIYLGAPRYLISVEAEDYKKCEKKMKGILEAVEKKLNSAGGTFAFERQED